MYAQHFGLNNAPFSISPDPRFLYLSGHHREALAHLFFGIDAGGGFVVLTGEVGTGKTTLCRCLVEQLPEDVDLALVFNPRLNSVELLASICDELHVPYDPGDESLKSLIDRLNQRLLQSHANGRRTIVLIDEAQNLTFDVLEQIRLLTNLETNRDKLLQIILVGQPELSDVLERPELRQLAQRISARFHLMPLSPIETQAYITHRMNVAGARQAVFTRPAVANIYRLTGGIPRLINLLCDRSLLGAYARSETSVGYWVVRRASNELRLRTHHEVTWRRRLALTAATLLMSGSVLFALHRLGILPEIYQQPAPPPVAEQTVPPALAAQPHDPAPAIPRPVAKSPRPLAQAATTETPAPAATAASFAEFLASPSLTREAAINQMMALWKVGPAQNEVEACRLAELTGLRCFTGAGEWYRLRNLNHPAVLEFRRKEGGRAYLTLIGARDQRVELAVGERRQSFNLMEILPFWRGGYTLVWRPPEGLALGKSLAPGERSPAVRWLRERLDAPTTVGQEDVYDADLRNRVVAFQTERGLPVDGVAGAYTILNLQAGTDGGPRLASPSP